MASIHFEPKVIVRVAAQVHVNMLASKTYVRAVSDDLMNTYANVDVLNSTAQIIRRMTAAANGLYEQFARFVDAVTRASAENSHQDDQFTDDVPEDFLDPITSDIMTDPVRLPSSYVIVDRATIARHLLSDEIDPFNRIPLRLADVVPEPELRDRIAAWLQEQRRKRATATLQKDAGGSAAPS